MAQFAPPQILLWLKANLYLAMLAHSFTGSKRHLFNVCIFKKNYVIELNEKTLLALYLVNQNSVDATLR